MTMGTTDHGERIRQPHQLTSTYLSRTQAAGSTCKQKASYSNRNRNFCLCGPAIAIKKWNLESASNTTMSDVRFSSSSSRAATTTPCSPQQQQPEHNLTMAIEIVTHRQQHGNHKIVWANEERVRKCWQYREGKDV